MNRLDWALRGVALAALAFLVAALVLTVVQAKHILDPKYPFIPVALPLAVAGCGLGMLLVGKGMIRTQESIGQAGNYPYKQYRSDQAKKIKEAEKARNAQKKAQPPPKKASSSDTSSSSESDS